MSLDTQDNNHIVDVFSVEAAEDFKLIKAGSYNAIVVDAGIKKATSGTEGYTIHYRIEGGEYDGQSVWQNLWFTSAAAPFSKRELLKLGLTNNKDVREKRLNRLRCKIRVNKRKDDNGTERNEVGFIDRIFGIAPMPVSSIAPAPKPANDKILTEEQFHTEVKSWGNENEDDEISKKLMALEGEK